MHEPAASLRDAHGRARVIRRRQLAAEYRARASALQLYALRVRREGDIAEAEEAEATSCDYMTAADELEYGRA